MGQLEKNKNVANFALLQLVLSEDVQSVVGVMLQVAQVLNRMMNTFMPAVVQLQKYLTSVDDLNLVSNAEFSEVRFFAHPNQFSKRRNAGDVASKSDWLSLILFITATSRLQFDSGSLG